MADAVRWWFILELLGLLALPLCGLVLRALPDRGYTVSKAFGWLLAGWLTWLAASLKIAPFGPASAGYCLLLLGAFSFLSLFLHKGGYFRAWTLYFRERWLFVLAVEATFGLAFAAMVLVRGHMPEIFGTEKPMEYMYIQTLYSSVSMPPPDLWLSGHQINYYYFGFFLNAFIGRLAYVPPQIAFNLGLAGTWAVTLVALAGLGYNAVGVEGLGPPLRHRDQTLQAVLASVLAPFLVLFTGNPAGTLAGLRWMQGNRPFNWWWGPSRVVLDNIPGRAGPQETINEFPAFSFLLGDLHPHVTAMPAFALGLACSLALLLSARRPRGHTVVTLLFAGALTGWLYMINSWDVPVIATLVVSAVFAGGGFGPGVVGAGPRGVEGLVSVPGLVSDANQTTATQRDQTRKDGDRAGAAERDLGGKVPSKQVTGLQHRDLPPDQTLQEDPAQARHEFATPGPSSRPNPPGDVCLRRGGGIRTNRRMRVLRASYFLLPGLVPLVAAAAAAPFLLTFAAPVNSGAALSPLVASLPVISSIGHYVGAVSWDHTDLTEFLRMWGVQGFCLSLALLAYGRGVTRRGWVVAGLALLASLAPTLMLSAPVLLLLPVSVLCLILAVSVEPPALRWAFLLAAAGWALVFVPELIYLRDVFESRMNTVFKAYYQAWQILGVASAVMVVGSVHKLTLTVRHWSGGRSRPNNPKPSDTGTFLKGLGPEPQQTQTLRHRDLPGGFGLALRQLLCLRPSGSGLAVWQLSGLRPRPDPEPRPIPPPPNQTLHHPRSRIPVAAPIVAAVLLVSLAYPYAGIRTRTSSGYQGLDGTTFLRDEDGDAYRATGWLREHTAPGDVVLEATGDPYSLYARLATYGGRPTVLGWANHERQWHAGQPAALEEVAEAAADVQALYTPGNEGTRRALLKKLGVDYAFYGQMERQMQSEAGVAVQDPFAGFLRPVARFTGSTLYRVR